MKNKKNFVLDLKDTLRAILLALLFSLIFILLFALVIRWADLDEKTIVPVNYGIKFLSLFLGVLLGFKNGKNGILKGVISGLIFLVLTFFIFSAMNGFKDVNFNWLDLIFLPIAGGIIGIIKVNLPARRK